MNMTFYRLILLLTLALVSPIAISAPGGPIGGIIVKGGKNPGGQMLVLATTDSNGRFEVQFAEGGNYRLEFGVENGKEQKDGRAGALHLEYAVRAKPAKARAAAKRGADTGEQARFATDIRNAQILITIPAGGATVAGELRETGASQPGTTAQRAINESGVSVKSAKAKGAVKH
jgi:hypothetical protein